MNVFEEYLNSEDLEKRERAKLWRTSIGLQDVDNLRVSNFLIETARKHIEGEISMDEVGRSIDEYYKRSNINYRIALLKTMQLVYKKMNHNGIFSLSFPKPRQLMSPVTFMETLISWCPSSVSNISLRTLC